MRAAARRRPVADPTIYPEEERVGEDILQRWIMELLRPLLQSWLLGRRIKAFVGADQFIYWRQHDSHARVAPDIYVLPGVDPRTRVRTWKLWQDRIVPSFAFEVVSGDWEKDYFEIPERYAEVGVRELVIFDPGFGAHADGVQWQVFRRLTKRGLVRVEATSADRVRSQVLGCWFRAVGLGNDLRVRIGEGAHGELLVPTPEEAERAAKEQERAAKEQERAAKEQERAAKEQERAAKERERAAREQERLSKEQERAAKEAALARVRELEAQLRRLTAARRRPRK
jgi:hypothetical protein